MDDLMKDVYIAHPKVHYNTDLEMKSIAIIAHMLSLNGLELQQLRIFNPNQAWLSKIYQERKANGDPDPFEIFREVARSCNIVVGITYLDGIIGAGVGEELNTAIKNGQEVYLLYLNESNVMFSPIKSLEEYGILSISETRKRNDEGRM
jgi:hypothetical protein